MTYVGGLRARLIRDSVYRTVYDGLETRGWFAVASSHLPVTFPAVPVDINAQVAFNTIGMSDEDMVPAPAELGSGFTEFSWPMFVDVYGEDDSISLHLVGDIAALLAGRMPSVGRTDPHVVVTDWTLATPVPIFVVQVEDVRTHKAHDFPHPWLQHWRSCSFTIVDAYCDETDP